MNDPGMDRWCRFKQTADRTAPASARRARKVLAASVPGGHTVGMGNADQVCATEEILLPYVFVGT